MELEHLERIFEAQNRKSAFYFNLKLLFNIISLISAVIYAYVTMEKRITDLENKILKVEEIKELERQIYMLEQRGKLIELDRVKRRINKSEP